MVQSIYILSLGFPECLTPSSLILRAAPNSLSSIFSHELVGRRGGGVPCALISRGKPSPLAHVVVEVVSHGTGNHRHCVVNI
jgi:hypothetical protein